MAQIGIRPLSQILRRVALSHRAGLDIRTIWEKEANRGSPAHRQRINSVALQIADGDSLAEAMSACDGYFPTLTCDLVDVGEKTGRLDDVLVGLAEHYENLLDLRRTFLMGVLWPGIELSLAICVIGLLILVMGMIPAGPSGPIDILGFGLVGMSGLVKYMFIVAATIGGVAWVVVALMRGWLGPKPLQLTMQLPVIGNCLRTSALSRLAWTLSLALDSGLDARRSIRMALQSTQNAYFTSQMGIVDGEIERGNQFHEALRETGLFPDDFLSSLETAEISGTHGESLARLANDYRDRAKATAKMLTVASTFALVGFVFVLIIFLIFRLAMFYIGTIEGALEGI